VSSRGRSLGPSRRRGRPLGQHFLFDRRVLARIVAAAGVSPGDAVLEVGPGTGSLTAELLRVGARVLAVEVDRSLRPALAAGVASTPAASTPWPATPLPLDPVRPGLAVLWQDAVRLDFPALATLSPGPWKLCSNLPYYITGPFLAAFLTSALPWSVAVLMVQAEAAARMAALPGSRTYGAFSCLLQYHAMAQPLFPVPRGAFRPPPAVESWVVRLERRAVPPTPAPRARFLRVVRAAFAQRRKTLRNALAAGLQVDPAEMQKALAAVGVDGQRRAETLTLAEFGAVAMALGVRADPGGGGPTAVAQGEPPG
jgi:16S rRNA (adenine1518-N6/adenine1519-N6)-dimethyltransferase